MFLRQRKNPHLIKTVRASQCGASLIQGYVQRSIAVLERDYHRKTFLSCCALLPVLTFAHFAGPVKFWPRNKNMKSVIAIIGLGSAILLLFVGAEVMEGTVDVWQMVKAAPREFFHYVSNSFSHDMILTAIVVIGVIAAIAYVRRVPATKVR
jgi:multisubunit Na+/H+ antiporter MnhC subunit